MYPLHSPLKIIILIDYVLRLKTLSQKINFCMSEEVAYVLDFLLKVWCSRFFGRGGLDWFDFICVKSMSFVMIPNQNFILHYGTNRNVYNDFWQKPHHCIIYLLTSLSF